MSLATTLWAAANVPGWLAFRRALQDPRGVQEARLRAILRANAATEFGRCHRFDAIRSLTEYRACVPLQGWGDVEPWVDRIAAGQPGVLTAEPVLMLETTGGTTARKRIPYTARLQREMRAAVAPWIIDLYRSQPALARGRAYWSITPAVQLPAEGPVPVGFEDDAAYLGGRWRRLAAAGLAVPSSVRHVADLAAFRYVTLLFLLHARDLALISVWHPSFLGLLLDALEPHFERLLRDLREGSLDPPAPLPTALQAALRAFLRARPARAREVEAAGPAATGRLWPSLRLVSCWGDGHAAGLLPALRGRLPGVEIQPKGLLATEGCVTLPFAGATPLAIRSHVFEFVDVAGVAHFAHEIQPGRSYTVVLTTSGGLYRYRLGDRVEVTGRLEATPTLRFLGKEDHVSDLVGEKLDEGFVARCLEDALAPASQAPRGFALLAPDRTTTPAGYTLYLDGLPPPGLAARLDAALSAHGDYRYARALGQLQPVRLFHVAEPAPAAYLESCRRAGQRLGDVKPLALSRRDDWSSVFSGRYADS